jgi:LPXTG-motif cell wall-anchored protein
MKRLFLSLVVAVAAALGGGLLGVAPVHADIVPTPATIDVGGSVTITGSEFTPGAPLTVTGTDPFGDGWSHSPYMGVVPDPEGNFTLTLGDSMTPFRGPGTWTVTISDGTNTFSTTVEVTADDTYGATLNDVSTAGCTVSVTFTTSGTGAFTVQLQGGGEAGDYEGPAAGVTATSSPQTHAVSLAPIDWPGWDPQDPDSYFLFLRVYDPDGAVVAVEDTWSFDATACPAVASTTTVAPTTSGAPGSTDAPTTTGAPGQTDAPTTTGGPAPTTAAAGTGGGTPTQLPRTGSTTPTVVTAIGALLTLSGAVLVQRTRRSSPA